MTTSDDTSKNQPAVFDRLIAVTPPGTVKRSSQERLDRIHRRMMNDPMWQRDDEDDEPTEWAEAARPHADDYNKPDEDQP